MFDNAWVFDIETYPNCFTLVARKLDSREYITFIIHESQNDLEALVEWLQSKPILIGFNSVSFDGQVIEFIWREPEKASPEAIYKLAMDCIFSDRFDLPYSEWDFSFRHIDLYKMNHYDSGARACSLKWLEFTLRYPKMSDLPIPEGSEITPSNVSRVVSYNKNDVNVTYDFFYKCIPQIELRRELIRKYREGRMMNMSDSSLASYILKKILSKKMNISESKLSKLRTSRRTINVGDVLLPYISFDSEVFQGVLDAYKNLTIDGKKGLKGKHKMEVEFDGMEFVYGTGGLHGCWKSGVFNSDEENVIVTVDVTSYYPRMAMVNNWYPEHLGEQFVKIYETIFNERQKYEKGTALNYALKIILNSVYGKTNSAYSFLYDPQYTIGITVNGQLLLTMLAEALSSVGRLLLANTDGIEIMIPRSKVQELKDICHEWEGLTGLELEYGEYKQIVIRDVNSYFAVKPDGSAKRKGFFEVYDDICGLGGDAINYHKNPSGSIIPQAIFNYYANNIPVEDTIYQCNNIHEFLYAMKRRRGFEYWLIHADEQGHVSIDKRDERVIRFYVAHNGATIFKFWDDSKIKFKGERYEKHDLMDKVLERNDAEEIKEVFMTLRNAQNKHRLQEIKKGHVVQLAMNIVDENIDALYKSGVNKGTPRNDFEDLNREHYIHEAYKVIEEIEAE